MWGCKVLKYYRVRENAEPTYYTPYWQKDDGVHEGTFAVRSSLAGEALVPSLRDAVRQVDSNLPVLNVRTQDGQIDANLRQEHLFAVLTSGFGVLALVLACMGIYGLMAYSVSQRTNEIGTRMVLGAKATRVRSMILHESAMLAVIGIVVGLAGAVALMRLIKSMFYGITPNDPLTFPVPLCCCCWWH